MRVAVMLLLLVSLCCAANWGPPTNRAPTHEYLTNIFAAAQERYIAAFGSNFEITVTLSYDTGAYTSTVTAVTNVTGGVTNITGLTNYYVATANRLATNEVPRYPPYEWYESLWEKVIVTVEKNYAYLQYWHADTNGKFDTYFANTNIVGDDANDPPWMNMTALLYHLGIGRVTNIATNAVGVITDGKWRLLNYAPDTSPLVLGQIDYRYGFGGMTATNFANGNGTYYYAGDDFANYEYTNTAGNWISIFDNTIEMTEDDYLTTFFSTNLWWWYTTDLDPPYTNWKVYVSSGGSTNDAERGIVTPSLTWVYHRMLELPDYAGRTATPYAVYHPGLTNTTSHTGLVVTLEGAIVSAIIDTNIASGYVIIENTSEGQTFSASTNLAFTSMWYSVTNAIVTGGQGHTNAIITLEYTDISEWHGDQNTGPSYLWSKTNLHLMYLCLDELKWIGLTANNEVNANIVYYTTNFVETTFYYDTDTNTELDEICGALDSEIVTYIADAMSPLAVWRHTERYGDTRAGDDQTNCLPSTEAGAVELRTPKYKIIETRYQTNAIPTADFYAYDWSYEHGAGGVSTEYVEYCGAPFTVFTNMTYIWSETLAPIDVSGTNYLASSERLEMYNDPACGLCNDPTATNHVGQSGEDTFTVLYSTNYPGHGSCDIIATWYSEEQILRQHFGVLKYNVTNGFRYQ